MRIATALCTAILLWTAASTGQRQQPAAEELFARIEAPVSELEDHQIQSAAQHVAFLAAFRGEVKQIDGWS